MSSLRGSKPGKVKLPNDFWLIHPKPIDSNLGVSDKYMWNVDAAKLPLMVVSEFFIIKVDEFRVKAET